MYDFVAFRSILAAWYSDHGRQYPWREIANRTPYSSAVAELMLRRTRADQVVPVYLDFMARFPTLESAARADPLEIRKVLYPLGLAWRADSMVEFVREAQEKFGTELPVAPELTRTLPGIGEYVGGAISVFGGRGQAVLIDVNVVRVLGRIFGLDYSGEARRRKAMRDLAAQAVDLQNPADYHYAILDFAAKVCIARNPKCNVCPFSDTIPCSYFIGRKAAELTTIKEPPVQ